MFFAGSITMEDLIAVLPFGSTFDLVQLKGSTIRKAFEHGVRRYGSSTGEFLQVSGTAVWKESVACQSTTHTLFCPTATHTHTHTHTTWAA